MIARILGLFFSLSIAVTAHAVDLVAVYKQALSSDPTFQRAIAQQLVSKQGLPISFAAILPSLILTGSPSVTRSGYSGTTYLSQAIVTPGAIYPRNVTQRGNTIALTLTQTIFNFSQFSGIAKEWALTKQADALLNASLQDLILRVAKAYFAVLQDEENISYKKAARVNYKQQLYQMREQFKVGLKTQTDVYIAEATFNSAAADLIAAETALMTDRENLRAITGVYYEKLAPLNKNFPLVQPEPRAIDPWIQKAQRQNWQLKAAQHKMESARQEVKQQFAGHLPTVGIQVTAQRSYSDTINQYQTFAVRNGPGTETDKSFAINVNVPLLQGGLVVAKTKQATYAYQLAQQELELTLRTTLNTTRTSYMNILAGISKIKADRLAIKSNLSSLKGFETNYQVGTDTFVNLLNQQEKVLQAQTMYAKDRYEFIYNILLLKQAAGILSIEDVKNINSWLR